MKSKLLHTPEGVRDVYGTEFLRKKYVCGQLTNQLHQYGYSDIQTPMFEYFDVFSNDIGTIPARELYKFFDKEGETLVLRPDFTPAIARCAAKYFMEDDIPLRFCYEGNTFTNTSELQGKYKETTQIGAELIGDNSIYADAEILSMVIEGLKSTGLKDFQVSIGEVSYFRGLCEEYKLSEEEELTLRDYLSAKNFFGAEEYLNSRQISSEWIMNLYPFVNDFKLSDLRNYVKNDKSLDAVRHLEEVYEILGKSGYEKYVSFDMSILSKYHYYSGILFRAYTYGVGDAIVKGGRYDGLLDKFGKHSAAIGCVFLADEIQTALLRQEITFCNYSNKTLLLYKAETYLKAVEKAKELRKQSKNVALILKEEVRSIAEYEVYAKDNGFECVLVLLEEDN